MKKNYPVTGRELDFPSDAIILSTTDLKGRITYCNKDFIDVSGFTENELYGKAHNIVRHPDMPPLAFADLWHSLKAGKSWMGMVKNRCKNGDHYWVSAYAMPILENGTAVEYQSVRTKASRAQIQRAERLYPKLMAGHLPLATRLPALTTTQRLLAGFSLALAIPLVLMLRAGVPLLDTALAALFGLGIAGWTAHLTGRRIARLAQRSKTVIDNKLMQYLYTNSTDDIGQLEFALRVREAEQHAIIGRSLDSAGKVKTSAGALNETMSQTTGAVQKQQVEIEQVATAMNQMSATVREVAANAASAATAADNSANSTHTGQVVVREVVQAIRTLADEIKRTTTAINELQNKSGEIGGVLDVIRNIADQTNLLALNAAIEAARAGDQGRGFAVVADEVRTLAQRTQQSTQEIEEMIAGFRQAADHAVQVMAHSMELSNNGVEHAGEAESALQEIEQAVGVIRDMISQIATAAEEQSAVAEEIRSNIDTISESALTTTRDVDHTMQVARQLEENTIQQERLMDQFRSSS